MNDNERVPELETAHLYVAIRRKKENRDLKEICFRQLIRDPQIDLEILKTKINSQPGTWRIYQTINKRNLAIGLKQVMKKLIDDPDNYKHRIDSLWKTELMKPCCKAERNMLVDIDKEYSEKMLNSFISDLNINIIEKIKTPNGWHLVITKCDTRMFAGLNEVEIKRDGYVFMEKIVVEEVGNKNEMERTSKNSV